LATGHFSKSALILGLAKIAAEDALKAQRRNARRAEEILAKGKNRVKKT
jgi:hypothetical protein